MTKNWPSIKIKYLLANRITGSWGSEPEDGNSIVCIRAADIDTDKIRHVENDLTRRSYEFSELDRKKLVKGDLIIEKSGGGDKQIVGRIVSFELNEPALCSNFLEILRPDQAKLFSRFGAYLLYSLWSNRFIFPFIKQTTGIQNLDIGEYLNYKVDLPPIDIQKRIANYLDRETQEIDTLITAKEKLLSLLAEKRQALIQQAVICGLDLDVPMKDSGVEWLGEVPAHWTVMRLKWLYKKVEQGWSPQAENVIPEEDQWGVVKLSAIKNGEFDDTKIKALPEELDIPRHLEINKGDFLVTRANTPTLVGDVCLVKKTRRKVILSDLVYRLTLKERKISGAFLNYYLLTIGRKQIEADARGTSNSMVKISQEHISNWLIVVPPINEQLNVVHFLDTKVARLDDLRKATENTIELLKERRAALISAAVTGQIEIPAL